MPKSLTRRGLIGAALAVSATFASETVSAAPARFEAATNVWTGSLLQDHDGRSFVLRDFQQPIVLLKLWANWCPACVSEMPPLASMAGAMTSDVEVVLVSHPQYWEADVAAARRRKLPFRLATFASSSPTTMVQQALTDQAGRYVVPRSLVFRQRDYAIVSESEGAKDWSLEATRSKLKAWLG